MIALCSILAKACQQFRLLAEQIDDLFGSWSDTIGYEVLLAATERVRRVWLHEHE